MMTPRLYHSTVLENIDAVGVSHGRQTMRDQESGPPFGGSIEGGLDDGLALCV
jgi:hypothetical protein